MDRRFHLHGFDRHQHVAGANRLAGRGEGARVDIGAPTWAALPGFRLAAGSGTGGALGAVRNLDAARLTLDGKTLWVTELAGGQLHKVSLSDPTTIAPFGSSVVYSFLGGGPDSLRIDADGNIYLAIYGQGRIMGSIPTGFPIGQYLLPGRDQGHNLRSTSMLIRPGTDELLILMTGTKEGSTIFAARALARAAQ